MIDLDSIKAKYPPYSGRPGNRFIDHTGEKIGHLTLLYRGENDPAVSRPRARYVCLCDCGNVTIQRGENIMQRRDNVSCGHCKEFQFSQLTELAHFYIIDTFQSPDDNDRWHCTIQCKECHAIFTPRRTDLYNNFDYECPKCTAGKNIEIGDIIGELTVLSKEVDEENHLKYLCECSCGKQLWLNGCQLNSRRTCGEHNNPDDIVGQIFGRLEVLSSTSEFRGGQRMYICQCSCGTETMVGRNNLLTGHTSSCGCLNSKGEEKISIILLANNISFEKAKTFPDFFRSDIHGKLKFDFYLPEQNYAIEYDGVQHFGEQHHTFSGWHSKENYELTHQRDLFKNQYCFSHGIGLIRIPYWRLDDLCLADLLLDKTSYLLTPENEARYYEN